MKKKKNRHDINHRWNSIYLMLKFCVGYNDILLDYDNSKIGEIKITSNNWEKDFAFLNFLKVFYDTINMCSTLYTPTSCITLRCICIMSVLFQ